MSYKKGTLRIELKFLLYFLRNRCTRTFTPKRLKLELLVGWQVNKNNSHICSTSILHRRQKGCYQLHSAFSITNKRDQKLCSARYILQKHSILRLLADLEPIVLDLEPIVLDRSRVGNQLIYLSNGAPTRR